MSRGRLADLSVSFTPTSSKSRMPDFGISVDAFTTGPVEPSTPQIPEWNYLQAISGIQPFLIASLIPDLIYLLNYDGLHDVLKEIYPIPQAEGVNLEPQEIPSEVSANKLRQEKVKEAFELGGLENALNEIFFPGDSDVINTPDVTQKKQQYYDSIYQRGANSLAQLVAKSDPQNPNSLIFNHHSQEVHQETQKIEIDLIKNEPELVEGNIQCECGNRKVQLTSKQLRSADEPATVFARCVACKRQWKFSQA